jgi:hypothetical protein
MKDARREIHLGLALLCTITLNVVPHAQQTAQPGGHNPTPSSTVPRSVPFNGQLTAPKGDARMARVMLTFGLYTDQQGGTPLWTEQQLVTLDADGRYSVILGGMSTDGLPGDAFATAAPKWLGVQVEGEKEQPRFMLLSVPYALKAADADHDRREAGISFRSADRPVRFQVPGNTVAPRAEADEPIHVDDRQAAEVRRHVEWYGGFDRC